MTTQDKMKMTAVEIQERLANGVVVSKEDMRFLKSYLNINTRPAPNAGKQWKSKKNGINR